MPYHDIRMPADTQRADYAVSANIGRTLDACRQAVIDVRCCLDWLEQQGYSRLGILGTSLGSCYAFLATAHDSAHPRGGLQSCCHVRCGRGMARTIHSPHSSGTRSANRSRSASLLWSGISPISYFDQFARWRRKSLIIYAKYDLTFLPEFSRHAVEEFEGTAWITKSSCCPAATTPPEKRRINTWMAGNWLRSCAQHSKAV